MEQKVAKAHKNFLEASQTALASVTTKSAKSLNKLFIDSETVKADSIKDSNQNKKAIKNIKASVKTSEKSKISAKKAKNKSEKIKTGKFCGYKVKNAKAKGNTVNITVKTKNGKTAKGTISYADDGSRITTLTIGKKTTTKVIDRKGNLREKTITDKKAKNKKVIEYDGKEIINKVTVTKDRDPSYKKTTYYDDEEKVSARTIKTEDKTQKVQYEYGKNGEIVGIYTQTTDYSGDSIKKSEKYRIISNNGEGNIITEKNSNGKVKTNIRFIGFDDSSKKLILQETSNGKLDKGFSQKNGGDCWFLAGIKALSSSKAGEKIIQEAIKKNPDGSINVTFKGVNRPQGKTYTLSAMEIIKKRSNENYSDGDDDAFILELAVEKLRADIYNDKVDTGTNKSNTIGHEKTLNGGYTTEAIFYFTGDLGNTFYEPNEVFINVLLDEIMESNGNKVACFSLDAGEYNAKVVDSSQHNFAFKLNSGLHAFSISKITDKTVTFQNPWNTGEDYTVTREEFAKMCPADFEISVIER